MNFGAFRSAFGVLGITLLLSGLSHARQPGEGSGKGTIGLVCVSAAGETLFWNASNPEQLERFNACIEDVVIAWTQEDTENSSKNSTPLPNIDDRVGGIEAYRFAFGKSSASTHHAEDHRYLCPLVKQGESK